MSSPWEDHHEEEEGEGWLVSYADMVTLLFGFFVILWTLSRSDDKRYEQMSQKIVEAFTGKSHHKSSEIDSGFVSEFRQLRAFRLLVERISLGEDVDAATRKIEKFVNQETEAENAKKFLDKRLTSADQEEVNIIKKFDENAGAEIPFIEIILPDRTLFAPGSDELMQFSQKKVIALAADIKKIPNLLGIEIVGHSDSTPPGTGGKFRDNFALSSARAGSVARALISGGIDENLLYIRGVAHLDPLMDENNPSPGLREKAREKNRRVQIILRRKAQINGKGE